VNRGDVWWVTARGGRRPACVLTRDEAIPLLRRLLIAPATTRIRGIPTEVELDLSDGMPKACALSLDNLQTVPKANLVSRITTLSPARMNQVCSALAAAADC
jgi:mRNA interferase MazF